MKIWIDADACPKVIKEVVFKASSRAQVPVTLVANSGMFVPESNLINLVIVDHGLDVADSYILTHSNKGDLVVTADIPLAAQLVAKHVVAINPRGSVYTEDNVHDVLATRNLMQDLRGAGMIQGGPPPFGPKDKANFANGFDQELTKLLRARK